MHCLRFDAERILQLYDTWRKTHSTTFKSLSPKRQPVEWSAVSETLTIIH